MKKFLLVLGMVACIFGMYTMSPATVYASGSGEEIPAEEAMNYAVYYIDQLNEIVLTGMVEQYADNEAAYNALNDWKEALNGMGEYLGVLSADGTAHGDELTIVAALDGAVQDADMTILVDFETGTVISSNTDVRKTFGEMMTNAALNTLLGMGTVFIVLILIACLIGCFKYIPVIQEKFSGKKKAEAPKAAPAPVVAAPVVEVAEEDDLELIAVIAAAIAASEGAASADGFVVRSIKRRGNKWQKA